VVVSQMREARVLPGLLPTGRPPFEPDVSGRVRARGGRHALDVGKVEPHAHELPALHGDEQQFR
jgi:hypothetical protein